jgi:hypothetical protein
MAKRLVWLLAGVLCATSLLKAAEDPALADIGALLLPLRANTIGSGGGRDATPALTGVKHKLKGWIESRLPEFRDEDDATIFAHELNGEIRNAGFPVTLHPYLARMVAPIALGRAISARSHCISGPP